MDAASILKAQGWRGTGHSLDSEGRGLAKPLLISNKQDLLGVGKKKNLVSDQWWMRAFDESLKELGTGKKTALQSVAENGIARGGLYGFFVKGEGLQGTIDSDTTEPTSTAAPYTSSNTSAHSSDSTSATSSNEETSSDEDTNTIKKAKNTKASKRSAADDGKAFLKKQRKKNKTDDATNYALWLQKLQTTRRRIAGRDAEMNSVTLAEQMKRVGWDLDPATFAETKRAFILLKKQKRQALHLHRTVEEVIKYGDTLTAKVQDEKQATPPLPLKSALADLPPDKLTQYKQRAVAKGLSLEAYYEERQKKNRIKKRQKKRGAGFISLDPTAMEEENDNENKTKQSWVKKVRDIVIKEHGQDPLTATKEERKAAVKVLKKQAKRKAEKADPDRREEDRGKKRQKRRGGRNE